MLFSTSLFCSNCCTCFKMINIYSNWCRLFLYTSYLLVIFEKWICWKTFFHSSEYLTSVKHLHWFQIISYSRITNIILFVRYKNIWFCISARINHGIWLVSKFQLAGGRSIIQWQVLTVYASVKFAVHLINASMMTKEKILPRNIY